MESSELEGATHTSEPTTAMAAKKPAKMNTSSVESRKVQKFQLRCQQAPRLVPMKPNSERKMAPRKMAARAGGWESRGWRRRR